MQTLLIAVSGGLVALALAAGYVHTRTRRRLRGPGDAPGAPAGATAGIPPLRITLAEAPPEDSPFRDADAVAAASRSFEAAGYRSTGDYAIDEMEGVALRGFWHPRTHAFAVVYDHPQAGVFADLVCLFRDRTLVTVTTGPDSGMDTPGYAERIRVPFDIGDLETAGKLHECLVEASLDRHPVRKRPQSFPDVFTQAYAMEMDWRIRRGGVTEREVRRAAAAGGLAEPDAKQVELVRAGWRNSIDAFVGDQILHAFHAQVAGSILDWEKLRDRLAVVHDLDGGSGWFEMLAGWIAADHGGADDDRALDAARARLEPLFADGTRAGFAAAQPLLCETRRFERLGSVEAPWAGDVYARTDGTSLSRDTT